MNTNREHQLVLNYAAQVVSEVTYYTPDRRKVAALVGPVFGEDVKRLSRRPVRNVLSTARSMTWTPHGVSTALAVPLFWVIAAAVYVVLTLVGPFSFFGGDGFIVGIGAGMANAGISVGICAGLYLVEGWLARREADGWAEYDALVADESTIAFIPDDDVAAVARRIADIDAGLDRMTHQGLSTAEYEAQLIPLVEDAMLYASDCHQNHREYVTGQRIVHGISDDAIASDDDLRDLHDDLEDLQSGLHERYTRWMNSLWNLEHLGKEIGQEADLAEAKIDATRWNVQHGNERN